MLLNVPAMPAEVPALCADRDMLPQVSPADAGLNTSAKAASKEDMDSLVVAHLMQLSEGTTSSFVWLLASYERAQNELRQLSPRLDQQAAQQARDGLAGIQELCVSYGGLLLADLFPQVRSCLSR